MNNIEYDVIVIGSGPAGVAAAITCSMQGIKTCIITKANYSKVPGKDISIPTESVHPGISSLLKMIDADGVLTASSRATYDGIQTGAQYSYLGSDEEGVWKGHHIDRGFFDAALLQCAKDHNINLFYNETVSSIIKDDNRISGVKTISGKDISCRYVIDASGRSMITGKKLKFKERFLSSSFVSWTGVSKEISEDVFASLKTSFTPSEEGWTWLAPEPPDRCTWTRIAAKGEKEFAPPAVLSQFPVSGDIVVANMRWRVFRPLCAEGIVLCGDAAGILDPAAGQGILTALWSGIYAARTVVSCFGDSLHEAIHLAQYDDWYLTQFLEKAERLQQYYTELGIKLFSK